MQRHQSVTSDDEMCGTATFSVLGSFFVCVCVLLSLGTVTLNFFLSFLLIKKLHHLILMFPLQSFFNGTSKAL